MTVTASIVWWWQRFDEKFACVHPSTDPGSAKIKQYPLHSIKVIGNGKLLYHVRMHLRQRHCITATLVFSSWYRKKYYIILSFTIVKYSIVSYTILYYTILYYTIRYYAILNYTIIYYTTTYCSILHHKSCSTILC